MKKLMLIALFAIVAQSAHGLSIAAYKKCQNAGGRWVSGSMPGSGSCHVESGHYWSAQANRWIKDGLMG